jgi:uncharacterized protein involved in exopolysaccharide biosynthesis
VQEALYKYVRQRYEEYILQEAERNSSLIVLQKPWINEKKVRPRRGSITMLVFFFSLIFSLSLAVFLDFMQEQKRTKSNISRIAADIKKHIPFVS